MNGNGYYPFPIRQGSKKDFVGAWLMRFIVCGVLAYIARVGVEVRDDTRDLKKDLPAMQKDVGDLKRDVGELKLAHEESKKEIKLAAERAQKELNEAEQRVKNDFTRQLNEQLKKAKVQTKENMNYAR